VTIETLRLAIAAVKAKRKRGGHEKDQRKEMTREQAAWFMDSREQEGGLTR